MHDAAGQLGSGGSGAPTIVGMQTIFLAPHPLAWWSWQPATVRARFRPGDQPRTELDFRAQYTLTPLCRPLRELRDARPASTRAGAAKLQPFVEGSATRGSPAPARARRNCRRRIRRMRDAAGQLGSGGSGAPTIVGMQTIFLAPHPLAWWSWRPRRDRNRQLRAGAAKLSSKDPQDARRGWPIGIRWLGCADNSWHANHFPRTPSPCVVVMATRDRESTLPPRRPTAH